MTKVLSLIVALAFIGTFAGAADARGRCDHEYTGRGVTVFPFCSEAPRVGIHIAIPHGNSGHRCHRGCGHGRPMYRPMPVMQRPQCRPCVPGFARMPIPGKPCWCEPVE